MNDLRAFMADAMESASEVEYAATARAKDKKGDPVKWLLKPITSDEDEQIRRKCTKMVSTNKRGQRVPDFDHNKYTAELVCACVVFPNLNDAKLQNSYGVMGAAALVKKMLMPGEYTDLYTKVQEINGYDTTMEEMVEEAKN